MATSPVGKEPLISLNIKWVSKPVWMFQEGEKFLASTRNGTLDYPVHSLVRYWPCCPGSFTIPHSL